MNSVFAGLKKTYSQLGWDLKAARGMLSLVSCLGEFLRQPVTLEKANEEIKRALNHREQAFLDLVRTQMYGRAGGAYLNLLHMAGCDFADLRTHIRPHGLEKTLEKLAQEGVYLTQDDFKKKKWERETRSFTVSRRDL